MAAEVIVRLRFETLPPEEQELEALLERYLEDEGCVAAVCIEVEEC